MRNREHEKKRGRKLFPFFCPAPIFASSPLRPVTRILCEGVLTKPKWTKIPKCIFFSEYQNADLWVLWGGGGANAPRSPPWLRACHYLRAWNRLGRLLLYSFQIRLAPCLHVRQPHSQGSRPGRREPRERGCMCAAFFSSTLSNLC